MKNVYLDINDEILNEIFELESDNNIDEVLLEILGETASGKKGKKQNIKKKEKKEKEKKKSAKKKKMTLVISKIKK